MHKINIIKFFKLNLTNNASAASINILGSSNYSSVIKYFFLSSSLIFPFMYDNICRLYILSTFCDHILQNKFSNSYNFSHLLKYFWFLTFML